MSRHIYLLLSLFEIFLIITPIAQACNFSCDSSCYESKEHKSTLSLYGKSDGGSTNTTESSFLVAAVDSPNSIKELADYVCDGNEDDIEIQDAIDFLSDGGTVFLSPGNFNIEDLITLIDDVNIMGYGDSTKVNLAENHVSDISVFYASNKTGISIRELIIDGQEQKQTSGNHYGIEMIDCNNIEIDCWIEDFRTADTKINNFEDRIVNRYYCDEFMPRELKLDICSGDSGWSIEKDNSGTAQICIYTDSPYDGNSNVELNAPSGQSTYFAYTFAEPVDLRFYPLFRVVLRYYSTYYAPATNKPELLIQLEDVNGCRLYNKAPTSAYDCTTVYKKLMKTITRTSPFPQDGDGWVDWHIISRNFAGDFNWDNVDMGFDLGNIKKVIIVQEGNTSGGPVRIILGNITCLRGTLRPLWLMAFDDTRKNRWEYTADYLLSKGMSATYFTNTVHIGSSDVYSSWEDYNDLYEAGFDIGNHSCTHGMLIPGQENSDEEDFLNGCISYDTWDWNTGVAMLQNRGYKRSAQFLSHRGGINSSGNSPYYLERFGSFFRSTWLIWSRGFCVPYGLDGVISPTPLKTKTDAGGDNTDMVLQVIKYHLVAGGFYHGVYPEAIPGSDWPLAWWQADVDFACERGCRIMSYSQLESLYPIDYKATIFPERDYIDTFIEVVDANNNYYGSWAGAGIIKNITDINNQPDYPRNVTITCTDSASPSGLIKIIGYDARGLYVFDEKDVLAGGKIETDVAFSGISKVIIPETISSQDTVQLGLGNEFGLSHWIVYWDDVSSIKKWGSTSPVTDVPVTKDIFQFAYNKQVVNWVGTIDLNSILDADHNCVEICYQSYLEPVTLTSDIDYSGVVDVNDIKILLEDWLADSNSPADIFKDGNNIVNFFDYSAVAEQWLYTSK